MKYRFMSATAVRKAAVSACLTTFRQKAPPPFRLPEFFCRNCYRPFSLPENLSAESTAAVSAV